MDFFPFEAEEYQEEAICSDGKRKATSRALEMGDSICFLVLNSINILGMGHVLYT